MDEYSAEFSRDIEPMAGAFDGKTHLADLYYSLLCDFVRRYKGVTEVTLPAWKTIRINGDFSQWRDVTTPSFRDTANDTNWRDAAGWAGTKSPHYTNRSGRNDFTELKVQRDAANWYFYARCRRSLSVPAGANWMNLFLNTDGDLHTGWQGFDYAVRWGRWKDKATLVLCRNTGGWNWQAVAQVSYVAKGAEMHLVVPKRYFANPASVGFKWADNIPVRGDPAGLAGFGRYGTQWAFYLAV